MAAQLLSVMGPEAALALNVLEESGKQFAIDLELQAQRRLEKGHPSHGASCS